MYCNTCLWYWSLTVRTGLDSKGWTASYGLHTEGWQACLHTACWAVWNEKGIWLHSPLFICWEKNFQEKKRKYISSSLSINFPCNYTWLKSSAKEGPGKRELGLSLEKQLNYVQCGARSYIKKAILQRVQQAMREIRIWDLTKTRKKECLFRYPMLSKPGQEAYKECH